LKAAIGDDFMELSGFYKLSAEERLKRIKEIAGLTDEEAELLRNTGALGMEVADRMVENVIGAVHLPLGIATNFRINGKDYLVPMAIEEPSVIAAASRAAKLTLPEGFTAEAEEPVMIGQMQLVGIKDTVGALKKLEEKKEDIVKLCGGQLKNLERYGGGIRDVVFRTLKTPRGEMVLAEFEVDMRDAMGANMMNTMLEAVSPTVAEIAGGETRLRIISNLATKRKVRAKAVWKIPEDAVNKVLDGYELAANDIYRCATHNKGVMNGIDAVALACGQDWRAIEAGMHAYAAIEGKYRPVSCYEKDNEGNLVGIIELPMAVATVGGATGTLDTAKVALKIIGAKTSKELGMVMACVGLANNFAALYALATEGIQRGHMKLHARNIAVLAGASTPEEIDRVAERMAKDNNYTTDFAKKILGEIRT
jgi:hydroxymethylglutaryl-CoA reductase